MKNKKLLTRLFALLASLVLVLALSLPCFADGVVSDNDFAIRTITFTDASFYDWLTDIQNISNVLKAVWLVDGVPINLELSSVTLDDNNTVTAVEFSLAQPTYVDGISNMLVATLSFYSSDRLVLYRGSVGGSYTGDNQPVDAFFGFSTFIIYYFVPIDTASTPTDPTTPSSDMYTNLFNILKDAVYGSDAELTGSQEYALTLISTILTYATILLPVILVIFIAVWCFKRF